ncbi:MAG: hypothetical protein VX663_00695 [Pseudomonadota bacterium]|nr:hypothetical protein [Pseudomonadota bacterium]
MSVESRSFPRTLLRIALLKASPADLPYAPNVSLVLVACYLAINVLLSPIGARGLELAAMLAVAEVGLLALFLRTVLALWKLRNRFVQTFSAAIGCGCGFSLAALPLAWGLQSLQGNPASTSPLPLLFVLLVVWNFVVIVHILRQALDTRLHVSVGLNLIYMLCSFQVSVLILAGSSAA